PAFEALVELLRSEGVRAERLTPSDARTMQPQLEVSDYAALVHDPDAGYADPIATAHGFADAATMEGAKVLHAHAVSSIATRARQVVGVKIRGAGLLSAERVIIAAGNWTRDLAATVKVRLPVRYVRGEVTILRRPVDFGAPPRIHFDFYGNTYSRPEGEKDTLTGYMNTDPGKTTPRHEFAESLPAATVRDLQTRLSKRFPRMMDAQPRGGWSGAYDVTPDSYPIVDRIGPDGLFVAVGFSGHGFKLCPEIGRLLAEYVATEKRPEPLVPLRASRFCILGDLFDRAHVAPVFREMVRRDVIEPLGAAGIEVWILAGNHDQPRRAVRSTSLDDYRGYSHVKVFRNPKMEIREFDGR